MLYIGLLLLALPVAAQTDQPTSAAGKDFYFTLFDHWNWNGNTDVPSVKFCGITICTIEDGDITFSVPTKTGDTHFHFDEYNNLATGLKNVDDAVLKGVHIHSTANCYIHAWVHGPTAGDETMILPKHLLGKQYMLQGIQGALVPDAEDNPVPTYSQFTIVGTENATSVVVTPRVQLRCVTNGQVIQPHQSASFTIQENDVLLFQPEDYTQDISGTLVESDRVVAVFQGNNITRIYSGENGPDFVWEQALPTDTWGKEFIVPKSAALQFNIPKFTALYDNTEVYCKVNGTRILVATLQAGESYARTFDTGSSGALEALHVWTTKPVCCHLFLTGNARNNGKGDPAMTLITPVDNMATDTRWMLEQVEDNMPYGFSLLVTTREEDEDKVKYNNIPLSALQPDGESIRRIVTDGFVTYELGISAYMGSKIAAEDGAGFSAYIRRIGKTTEASAFNISRPFKMPPPEPCIEGPLIFREDFGGNDPFDPPISNQKVQRTAYTQIYDTLSGMEDGHYLVSKSGYHNGGSWYHMCDHTHPNDYTRGYMMEIDGSRGDKIVYSHPVENLCPGAKMSFSAYVANITTPTAFLNQQHNWKYAYPQLTFEVINPSDYTVIARYKTDSIGHDWTYYGAPDEWEHSAEWQLMGVNFTVPEGLEKVELRITNNSPRQDYTGNDFAIDDIELHLCAPPVIIHVPDTVSLKDRATMTSEFSNDSSLTEPLEYQWFFSDDSLTFTPIPGATNQDWSVTITDNTYTGWYRLGVYSAGQRNTGCGILSDPQKMYVLTPDMCPDGRLLFREDFGGNDPEDPIVSYNTVSGMSSAYQQIYDTATCRSGQSGCQGMRSGAYLVAKRGYRNSTYTDYSCWHIMDDHTHFGDTTRGYFLEVDGKGGKDAFYSTIIDSLCEGTTLSFSAYVANITTAGQYDAWRSRGYVHPKMTFVITDPQTGTILAQQNTDTIAHDWSLRNVSGAWQYSAHWQLIGMRFTVPQGIDRVQLSIVNNVTNNTTGNDFALDDIEVRLCMPPVTIQGPDTVCVDTKNTLYARFENDGTLPEPLEYQWYFSADSLTWEPILLDGNTSELKLKAKPRHTGWYRVVAAGAGNITNPNCCAISEPFWFYVIEDCPPILCPEGILIYHEQSDSTTSPYQTTIQGLCTDMDLSFIAYVTGISELSPRLLLMLRDTATGRELGMYDTGDIPADGQPHPVGINLTVPENISEVELIIRNNAVGITEDDYRIDAIEARLCLEPISIKSTNPVCRKHAHTLEALYDNYDILQSPEYQWEYSSDSVLWTAIQTSQEKTYTIDTVHRTDEGWYRVIVANTGNTDKPNCRSVSEPFHLLTTYCNTAVDQYKDTTACDTLLPITWRGHEWRIDSTLVDTLRDIDIDDSVYVHKTLQTIICCPEILRYRLDSAVCDTLLPFPWAFIDTIPIFSDPGTQDIAYTHTKWHKCVGEIYTLALDTFHCERLYPILVNKYNWQLLLDNIALRRFFPERTPVAYRWYKNEQAIEGADQDDYSEQNILHGIFQLRVRLDDDLYVWSNILEILDTPAQQPVRIRVYNSRGWLIDEQTIEEGVFRPTLPSGIYLIQYQQSDHVWTEKILVP